MSIATYLNSLDNDRDTLAANLTTMGVQASSSETFTTLVPKVLTIPAGGDIEWMPTITPLTVPTSAPNNNNFGNLATGLTKLHIADVTIVGGQTGGIGLKNVTDLSFENVQFGDSSNAYGWTFDKDQFAGTTTLTFKNCRLNSSSPTTALSLKIVNGQVAYPTDVVFNGLTLENGRTTLSGFITGKGIASITGLNTITGVSNITDFSECFKNTSATSIDISSWNAAPTTIKSMFNQCTNLQLIDISGLDCTGITNSNNYQYAFGSSSSIVPTTCTIYVKDAANQAWFSAKFPSYTFTVKS